MEPVMGSRCAFVDAGQAALRHRSGGALRMDSLSAQRATAGVGHCVSEWHPAQALLP